MSDIHIAGPLDVGATSGAGASSPQLAAVSEGKLVAADGCRIALIVSRFNELVTKRLADGALDLLWRSGMDRAATPLIWVPGAFELPLVAAKVAELGEVDGIVCLGAVVRGGTDHYLHVSAQCAAGLARVQLDSGIPVGFGVLTTDTMEQAMDRAGGKSGNKGAEAARNVLETVNVIASLGKAGE